MQVYCSALNFRDVMTATGKISVDVVTQDRLAQECVQGFEFAGRDTKYVVSYVSFNRSVEPDPIEDFAPNNTFLIRIFR